MTKTAALYNFFSGFGIKAYPTTAVPSKISYPYLTYEVTTDDFGSAPVAIVCNIWYRTESETAPNAKVDEISRAIGSGGIMITCDEGAIWIKKGSPWCNSIPDTADLTIKRKALNLTIEYLTL